MMFHQDVAVAELHLENWIAKGKGKEASDALAAYET
jgi:hypothetical protein